MPVIPFLQPMQNKKLKTMMQDKFLGLCMRETADAGQFIDESGLSSDEYPYMSPEKPHKLVRDWSKDTDIYQARALLGGECLSWVANGHLYYDGNEICECTSTRPQMVRMGAYIVVWPDRIIYNTHTGELVQMDASKTYAGVTARPCMLSGQEYQYTASDTPPSNPTAMSYWYDTQTGGFYQFLDDEWQGIDTVYSRLEGPDLGKNFSDYDVVKISGFSYDEYNMDAATVYARGDDYIVIATGTVRDFEETNEVTISRTAPEMDYICENGNRLWGCNSEKHEIYGSKLGDPTNWNSYLGISTDSYAATVGSEGHFTGICSYMGYVLFWKEDRCHRLYGTRPENFQLMELPVRGVKTGCERSLVVCNGILYYVNRDGVMAFDGATAVNIGDVLGDTKLDSAAAGVHGEKVYLSVSMAHPSWEFGNDVTLVMDTKRGIWHMLRDLYGSSYASTPEGDFYISDTPEGNDYTYLFKIGGGTSKYQDETVQQWENTEWWGITGDYGMDSPNQKWLHKITLRLKAENQARMNIDIMYNSDGNWHRIYTYEATGINNYSGWNEAAQFMAPTKKSETLQLRTKRCDHFKLRYWGYGKIIITSITVSRDEGSERSV